MWEVGCRALSPLHFLMHLRDEGIGVSPAVALSRLGASFEVKADSVSVARAVRDSLTVEHDGASPESRLVSPCSFEWAMMLRLMLGSGEVLGRISGWIPRRADAGGGGATVVGIGALPAFISS